MPSLPPARLGLSEIFNPPRPGKLSAGCATLIDDALSSWNKVACCTVTGIAGTTRCTNLKESFAAEVDDTDCSCAPISQLSCEISAGTTTGHITSRASP